MLSAPALIDSIVAHDDDHSLWLQGEFLRKAQLIKGRLLLRQYVGEIWCEPLSPCRVEDMAACA